MKTKGVEGRTFLAQDGELKADFDNFLEKIIVGSAENHSAVLCALEKTEHFRIMRLLHKTRCGKLWKFNENKIRKGPPAGADARF